jgi:ankyrin repeat protein
MDIVWYENAVQGAGRLLATGADVNQRDASGTTALMFAATKGNLPLIQLLLAKGADPNLTNKRGESSLSCARDYHHAEVVTLLKQHGAKAGLFPHEVAPR